MKELQELMTLMAEMNKSVGGMKEGQDGVIKRIDAVDKSIIGIDTRLQVTEGAIRSKAVPSMPGVNEGKEKFSLQRAVLAIATKDWANAGYEERVIKETMAKALSVGTTTAGGFLVPAEAITELVEMIRAKTVTRELGATVLDGLTGSPVEIPRQTGGATMYWVGENTAITPSQQVLDQISMTPNQACAMTEMSNRLLRLSNPSAERMVTEDIARVLALGIDLAVLRGTGSANQPTGIANTVGILTVALGTNGATPTIDNLDDMLEEIDVANTLSDSNMGFVMHPRIHGIFRKLKDSENRYYLRPDPADATKKTVLGYPIRKTTQVPINLTKGTATNCSEIYFGNWREVIIALWGGLEILASQEAGTSFAANQTWIRIIQDVDVALRHAASMCLINDAKIA